MNLVTMQNDRPMTTSTVIAVTFGKQHGHVLRDIEDLLADMGACTQEKDRSKIGAISEPNKPIADMGACTQEKDLSKIGQISESGDSLAYTDGCTQEKDRSKIGQISETEGVQILDTTSDYFVKTTYADAYNRQQTMYEVTEEGFALLAMGFTGVQALEFKIEFLNEFKWLVAENRRLQIDNQTLLEQQTRTLQLENKTLADENFELNDRNEYLEDKKAMWKDERIQGILRDEVEAQIGIRHELEEKVFSDNWVTCNGDPMNKAEAKSRKKFVKQRFSQVNQGLKGLERVFKGTEQARNAAILMYINIIRQEIEFAHHW